MVPTRSLIVMVAAVSIGAQQPTSAAIDEVLERVGRYLIDYETRLSAVVAEERYEQWIETGGPGLATQAGRVGGTRAPAQPTRRTLVSDFLMMRWPGEAAWFGFRDVAMVDGKPVRDRDERLVKLFTENSRNVFERADLIAAESARHNIGDVFRNINVPTQALDFLHPRHRARFTFRKQGEETMDGRSLWRLEFEEREPPYLISTPSGKGVRARGMAWVQPADGAVLQTQLDLSVAEARQLLRTRITAVYRHQETLGLLVPVELRELHEQSDPASRAGAPVRVGGRAEYRNFRRFQASSEETLVVP